MSKIKRVMEDRKRLKCFKCGKPVSTPVPADCVIRGIIECPECISQAKGAAFKIKRASKGPIVRDLSEADNIEIESIDGLLEIIKKEDEELIIGIEGILPYIVIYDDYIES